MISPVIVFGKINIERTGGRKKARNIYGDRGVIVALGPVESSERGQSPSVSPSIEKQTRELLSGLFFYSLVILTSLDILLWPGYHYGMMENSKNMVHKIQKIILKNLLLQKELRFSDLNSEGIPNDHFSFHVKQLVSEGIVVKGDDGLYRLTQEGKEYANRFDVDGKEVVLQKQAKLAILVVGCDEKGRYLVQQRLKEPYYGFYGFVSGKIRWGETVLEAASRELKEEAGLEGELVFKGIEHKIDYSPEGKLLEDKYFYIVRATNLLGDFKEVFEAGKNYWLTKKEIEALPDLFPDVPKVIRAVEQDGFVFFEDKYTAARY